MTRKLLTLAFAALACGIAGAATTKWSAASINTSTTHELTGDDRFYAGQTFAISVTLNYSTQISGQDLFGLSEGNRWSGNYVNIRIANNENNYSIVLQGAGAGGSKQQVWTGVPTTTNTDYRLSIVVQRGAGDSQDKVYLYCNGTQIGDTLTLNMRTPDFSTAQQISERLNAAMGGPFAKAVDAASVEMRVPPQYRSNLVPLMASVENLEVTPDTAAKVVVDEKTGTVVLGRDVRISRAAVAHGNLQITVQESEQVSQPGPFSQGQTVVTPQTDINVREENRKLNMLEGATLQELVDGLNAIGATPRDLISILRSLKASGSLHADLEVI